MTAPREEWPALIKLRALTRRENAPLAELLLRCGSAEAACDAPAGLWREVCGFEPDRGRLGPEGDRRAEVAAGTLERLGAEILDVRDPDYPGSLRRLPQPPPVLFLRGRIELLHSPAIAVVGTRNHSVYGRDATVTLTVGLARAGYTIVSGLARGIDGIAHGTALDVGGATIAVLGNGIDVAYPPEHRELFDAIGRHGCLVSEFPPGTPPRKYHFPQRNRLIAGLARAVVVVEAGERSGALITADYAMEGGVDVFAVPGPIHNPTSRGPNELIRDGAGLVTSAADVLRALGFRTGEPLPEPLAGDLDVDALEGSISREPDPSASDLARRLWAALDGPARDADDLAVELGLPPSRLAPALVELELAGLVRRLPGPRYARAP